MNSATPPATSVVQYAHPLQPRAFAAPAANRGESFEQRRIVGIDMKREDVNRIVAPRDRELGSADESDPRVTCCGERLGEPVDDVVIGQGQHIDTALRRACDDRRWREHAVGIGRMAMEVVAWHRREMGAALSAGGIRPLERRA